MRKRWKRWKDEPERAPADCLRVCAYHIDFDENPTLWFDVATGEDGDFVIANLSRLISGKNLDYCIVYDELGEIVAHDRPY